MIEVSTAKLIFYPIRIVWYIKKQVLLIWLIKNRRPAMRSLLLAFDFKETHCIKPHICRLDEILDITLFLSNYMPQN